LELIDGAEVFQLFWSRSSARSTYVRQEWEHALGYEARRPRFIQPVWWEEPMEPPPPELTHLHFERVDIPVGTQFQLAFGRVRHWFGKRK
jgi:hypothetical protein